MATRGYGPLSLKDLPSLDMGGAGGSISARGFLVTQFNEFYAELDQMRARILRYGSANRSGNRGGADAQGPEEIFEPDIPQSALAGDAPPIPWLDRKDGDFNEPHLEGGRSEGVDLGLPPPASELAQRLQSILELQALEAGRRGGDYGILYYKEAQYVMAVLADEIFLSISWPGRDYWKQDLLETRLFGSYNAGEQFFSRLEALLANGDRVQSELAAVYLMALSLGFKGKYRGSLDLARLDDYRKQLYQMVYRRPASLGTGQERLSPQAYENTVEEGVRRWLPSPSRWYALVALCLLVFLIAGHWIWIDTTAPLWELLERLGPFASSDFHQGLLSPELARMSMGLG